MPLPKLIGQFNGTVRTIRSALKWLFSLQAKKKKILEFLVYRFKKEPYISQILLKL